MLCFRLFYDCLRASELCNLDESNLDLKSRTLRIREGEGGKDGFVMISSECVEILKRYLEIRSHLDIGGRSPFFYTDFGRGRDAIIDWCFGSCLLLAIMPKLRPS